jgi:hypothetical protein
MSASDSVLSKSKCAQRSTSTLRVQKSVRRRAATTTVTVTGKTVLDRMPGISYRTFWQTNYKRFIRVTCRGSRAISDKSKELQDDPGRDFRNEGEWKNSASRQCVKRKSLIRQLIKDTVRPQRPTCAIFILVIQKGSRPPRAPRRKNQTIIRQALRATARMLLRRRS